MWSCEAPYLKNEHGWVARTQIRNGNDYENADVVGYPKDGKQWQKWDITYVDDMGKEPVEGEMSEDFGLRVKQ
jgi:hypothetical protein